MKVVIDASVAVKWFVQDREDEENTDEAVNLLQQIQNGNFQAIQPVHWQAEVISVLSRLIPNQVETTVSLLDALDLEVQDNIEIYQKAASLSIELSHHLFDTLYHALALTRDATLITADKKYFNKAKNIGNISLLSET